ncbi:acetyltransferase [Flavobacterium cerinum]|uniref:Acetyltransferase n=1 Tax=Flavobacterium cerinum TaxID=2502784 RepID=A0ABY5IZ61_9FLAO|nr:acetyltransferase [Flavobacterium cerinum]UUC47028.1 acetyltransferase [Flavobacterium cerinum]
MKNIAIIGAGGFGREVKTILDDINAREPEFQFVGFYDDGVAKGTIVNGYPVLGGVEELNAVSEPLCIAMGIGDPKLKMKIVGKINNSNIQYPTIVHPGAIIGKDDVTIGQGTIICAGCILTCNINIGAFVTLNLMCTVGHDTRIEAFSSFMPAVNISGEVLINEKVYVGTGAKIINQLEIGTETIVGAGAVVSRSLPEKCTAVGIPAKPIKFHE